MSGMAAAAGASASAKKRQLDGMAVRGALEMLIAFGGLPGTGKTTVAQKLARELAAVYLRIDTLEQAFNTSVSGQADIGPAGYLAAYAIAGENLRLGSSVVADSVNSLNIRGSRGETLIFQAISCRHGKACSSDNMIHGLPLWI
jgi:hypothetical protein